MGLIDISIYVGIALLYNLLIHNLASLSYKDLQYDEKHQNTIIMLIMFGGIGILISKIINEKRIKYKNKYVSKGLYYGGVLLIVTALLTNWDAVEDEMKLLFVAGLFGCLIWFGQKREESVEEKKKEEGKINEEIITEIVESKNNNQRLEEVNEDDIMEKVNNLP